MWNLGRSKFKLIVSMNVASVVFASSLAYSAECPATIPTEATGAQIVACIQDMQQKLAAIHGPLPFNKSGYTEKPAMTVTNNGGGSAGVFMVTNSETARHALEVRTQGTGFAGYFFGGRPGVGKGKGVLISAADDQPGLQVVNGTKSAVVATSEGARSFYTEESTEVWFSDYGFGRLVNGRAVVSIDPLFVESVNSSEPYHVFVQAYGNADLYVSSRTPTAFEVHLHNGDPNIEFSYKIVAKRRGYERIRLEPAPWAHRDLNLEEANFDREQQAMDAKHLYHGSGRSRLTSPPG
jgi:hypothetical protein